MLPILMTIITLQVWCRSLAGAPPGVQNLNPRMESRASTETLNRRQTAVPILADE